MITVIALMRVLTQDSVESCEKFMLRICISPKIFSIVMLVLIYLMRFVWILIDPFCMNEYTSRIFDRIMYEMVFPLIFIDYSCILLVLMGLY